jgi:hypothetical protein
MRTHCGSLRRSTRSEELPRRNGPRSDGPALGSRLGDAVRWLSRADAHDVRLVHVVFLDRLVLAERDLRELVLLLLVLDAEGEESSVWGQRTARDDSRGADLDIDRSAGALEEVRDELGLEVAGEDGVGFLGVGNVDGLQDTASKSIGDE